MELKRDKIKREFLEAGAPQMIKLLERFQFPSNFLRDNASVFKRFMPDVRTAVLLALFEHQKLKDSALRALVDLVNKDKLWYAISYNQGISEDFFFEYSNKLSLKYIYSGDWNRDSNLNKWLKDKDNRSERLRLYLEMSGIPINIWSKDYDFYNTK